MRSGIKGSKRERNKLPDLLFNAIITDKLERMKTAGNDQDSLAIARSVNVKSVSYIRVKSGNRTEYEKPS